MGEVLKFDGFLKVYMESTDDESDAEGNDKMLPALAKGDVLALSSVTATERFSQAPARYTEASLVRKLEELGIGLLPMHQPFRPYSNANMSRRAIGKERSGNIVC